MTSTVQQALAQAAQRKASKPVKTNGKGSREGTVLISAHLDVSVRKRLLAIRAAHPELTMQDLLTEALDLLFKRHKQPRLR